MSTIRRITAVSLAVVILSLTFFVPAALAKKGDSDPFRRSTTTETDSTGDTDPFRRSGGGKKSSSYDATDSPTKG